MVANKITFQQTAKKNIALCIETSFGMEVVVISKKQAQKLADGLKQTVGAMPLENGQLTPSVLNALFNGT